MLDGSMSYIIRIGVSSSHASIHIVIYIVVAPVLKDALECCGFFHYFTDGQVFW